MPIGADPAETTVETPGGPARVALTAPDPNGPPDPGGTGGSGRPGAGLLVLTHGSAGSVDATDLVTLRRAALALGWSVAAVTQPFRLAGRRNPGAPAAQDAAWRDIVAALRATVPGPLVQAGRSNGARVACRTANDVGAAGVICLAFPVHPPGRPERHRLDELAVPACRVLVVQGDHDPFGMPNARRGRRKVVVVPGSDHSLRGATTVVTREVRTFLRSISAHSS